MTSEQRAATHERIADLQEATEERMHSVADTLPQKEDIDARADAVSGRARNHRRRARSLRESAE